MFVTFYSFTANYEKMKTHHILNLLVKFYCLWKSLKTRSLSSSADHYKKKRFLLLHYISCDYKHVSAKILQLIESRC